jgi:hypothetical protein
MRSSSVKSLFTAASLAATLILSVPAAAAARSAQPQETVTFRDELPRGIDRAARAIRRLVTRLIGGGIGVNDLPSQPVPHQ